jgi:hypothetical protein
MSPIAIDQHDFGLVRTSQLSDKMRGRNQTTDAASDNDDSMHVVSLKSGRPLLF